MNRRLACRAIILKDNKLLCVQQKHDLKVSEPWPDDVWCLPGGKLEDQEDLITCLQREIFEELGVAPQVGRLLYIQQFTFSEDWESLEFFFHVINSDDYKTIDLSSTSHGIAEIAKVQFIDQRSHNILPEFLVTEDINAILSTNQNPKLFNYL